LPKKKLVLIGVDPVSQPVLSGCRITEIPFPNNSSGS
jgi:hypothetical protein